MRLLLDTHIFLWFIAGDRRLPKSLRDAIRDESNEPLLSVVSVWEVMIKHQLGKLPLPQSPGIYLPIQRERHQIASLALDEASVARLSYLAPLHRDPFDRILISQAIQHELAIVTIDNLIRQYPVPTLNQL
jgi:PIN domain nuclease of toxin-antitoxin system